LKALFPNSVCDFAKPGVNQSGMTTYPSFGPSPVDLVFDPTKQ
jgi:hypothetical protein